VLRWLILFRVVGMISALNEHWIMYGKILNDGKILMSIDEGIIN
jgi:hypothetical protein